MAEEQAAPDDDSTPVTTLVASVVTMLTLVTAFGLMAVGWSYFWIIFPIGFGGVLPAATAFAVWREAKRKQTDTVRQTGAGGKLAVLREQYAKGEIDDATFQRRLERLLETESIEDAKLFYGDDADAIEDADGETPTPDQIQSEPEQLSGESDQANRIPEDEQF